MRHLIVSLLLSNALIGHAQDCGNGRLEALPSGQHTCPKVLSNKDFGITPETCDVHNDAGFGLFVDGCGKNTDTGVAGTACMAMDANNTLKGLVTAPHTGNTVKRSTQLLWAATESTGVNFDFDAHDTDLQTDVSSKAGICLYSDVAIDDNGNQVTNLKDATGCKITPAMYTTYTSLAYCLDTGDRDATTGAAGGAGASATAISGATGAMPMTVLNSVGSRLTSGSNFDLFGHKCMYTPGLRVKGPVHGDMHWLPETWDDTGLTKFLKKSDNNGAKEWTGVYDMCFEMNDPAWPTVHHSSSEFLAQSTRLTYSVICDPVDQYTSYPDDGKCENTVSGDPASNSHLCTRLGQQANPCEIAKQQWDLMVCDERGNATDHNCVSLSGKRKEYTNRFAANGHEWAGDTIPSGVEYVFEHDSDGDKNPFACSVKSFNNTRLYEEGYMTGDTTEAQFKYICKSGGQNTPCAEGMGEVVHSLSTCSGGTASSRPISQLDSQLDTVRWCKDNSGVYTCEANNNGGTDCSLSANQASAECKDSEWGRINTLENDPDNGGENGLRTYKTSCGKTLKLKVNKGVAGQMMLRVVVKSYNTAIDEADATRGYTYWTSAMVPVAIAAKVRVPNHALTQDSDFNTNGFMGDLTTLMENGLAVTNDVERHTGSINFFMNAQSQNPFHGMQVHENNPIVYNSWSSDIQRFSRSTRTNVEFIECTDTKGGNDALDIESEFVLNGATQPRIPRFRITSNSSGNLGELFFGDFNYLPKMYDGFSVSGLGWQEDWRLYQTKLHNSSDGPTIQQLRDFDVKLVLRSKEDRDAASSFWNQYPYMDNNSGAVTDNWHDGYPGKVQNNSKPGLCLMTRVSMYEPSSCDVQTLTSNPFYISAPPRRITATGASQLTVNFEQSTLLWKEDEMVPLRISVTHPDIATDSKLFYFSHIEIEDMWHADRHSDHNKDRAHYGGDFELFSYGSTMGDRTRVAPTGSAVAMHDTTSDTAADSVGISRVEAYKFRSFANSCTRWIYEQMLLEEASGTSGAKGGFLADGLAKGTFPTAEDCLTDARRTGEAIWGGDYVAATGSHQERVGVWMRPCRKCTMNVKLKVTVYGWDGDKAVWHKSQGVWDTADDTITLAHVPSQTRYNQFELRQQASGMLENKRGDMVLSTTLPAQDGIDVPLPLRKEVKVAGSTKDMAVCTYTHTTHNTNPKLIDAFSSPDNDDELDYDKRLKLIANRDKLCNPTGHAGSFPTNGDVNAQNDCTNPAPNNSTKKCFSYIGSIKQVSQSGCEVIPGYRITCDPLQTDHKKDRLEIESLVIFDESEGVPSDLKHYIVDTPTEPTKRLGMMCQSGDSNNTALCGLSRKYADGSDDWDDGKMIQPEQVAYQPAGDNNYAQKGVKQWYRIEACDAANEDVVDKVVWCTDGSGTAATDAYYTYGGYSANTYNASAVTSDTVAGNCHLVSRGAGSDTFNATNSYFPMSGNVLRNSYSTAVGVMGDAKNYWNVIRKSGKTGSTLATNTFCLQGLSHFNTEISNENLINLRLVAVVRDQLKVDGTILPHVGGNPVELGARSKSNTDQGKFSVTVTTVRDVADFEIKPVVWGSDTDPDQNKQVQPSFIEERNLESRDEVPTQKTWMDITSLVTGNLTTDVDCSGDKASSTFCLDRLQYIETTPYHDQHLGRISIKGYVQKRCGKEAETAFNAGGNEDDLWHDAAGLFTVQTEYTDDYVAYGSDTPGNGIYTISDSWSQLLRPLAANATTKVLHDCPDQAAPASGTGDPLKNGGGKACLVVSQRPAGDYQKYPTGPAFPNDKIEKDDGTPIADKKYGNANSRSLCDIDLKKMGDYGIGNTADYAEVRNTWCDFHTDDDVIGTNTFTWSNTKIYRVTENKCPKDNTQTTALSQRVDCPASTVNTGLLPRRIVPNLRFVLPERWSNCLRFKFEVKVANEDRENKLPYPSFSFGNNDVWASPTQGQDKANIYVEPQSRAEQPRMFIETTVSNPMECTGHGLTAAGCNGKGGTAAIGNLVTGLGAYDPPGPNSALGKTGGMMAIDMVAGYRSQVRIVASSSSTDNKDSHDYPIDGFPAVSHADMQGYKWDEYREELQPSGEVLYLTVESKYDALLNIGSVPREKQYFCLWMCPKGKELTGCSKNEMVRIQPLPEDATAHDFTKTNVNGEKCTHAQIKAGLCDEFGYPTNDPYGRNADLGMTCPTYKEGDDYAPGSRYSFRCNSYSPTGSANNNNGQNARSGECLEWRQLFIQYPGEQTHDDYLEFKVWSRQDWQGAAGYQHSSLSMNVKMRPAITLSTIGFSAGAEPSNAACQNQTLGLDEYPGTWCCDPNNPTVACPNGMYNVPMQKKIKANVEAGYTYPFQMTIYENDLHGFLDGPLQSSYTAPAGSVKQCVDDVQTVDDISLIGSNSTFSTDCGARFPVRFPDPSLATVAPVGLDILTFAIENPITETCVVVNKNPTNPTCLRDDGIEANAANIRAFTPGEIAQSLQMPCSKYSIAATNPSSVSECRSRFVSINDGTAEQKRQLRFMTDESGVGVNRAVAQNGWDFSTSASAHYGAPLEWAVGEKMTRKEVVLVGSDNNPNSQNDYSLSNNQCEKTRQFELQLKPHPGFSNEILQTGYDKVLISVKDDDYYGEFRLGYLGTHNEPYYLPWDSSANNGAGSPNGPNAVIDYDIVAPGKSTPQVVALNEKGSASDRHVTLMREGRVFDGSSAIDLGAWREDITGNTDGLHFYIQRSRTNRESVPPEASHGWNQQDRPMHAASVRVRVTYADIAASDFKIVYSTREGNPGEKLGQEKEIAGSTIAKNDGYFTIDFTSCEPLTLQEMNDCTAASQAGLWATSMNNVSLTKAQAQAAAAIAANSDPSVGRCSCASTLTPKVTGGSAGTQRASEAFQWMKISFVSTNDASVCNFAVEQEIRFTVASVHYPSTGVEAAFAGDDLSSGGDCPRNPHPAVQYTGDESVQYSTSVKFVLNVNETADNIRDAKPFRNVWAGLNPLNENPKDAPLTWYGTTVSSGNNEALGALYGLGNLAITETEHSECSWSGDPQTMSCNQRSFRMYICLQSRQDDAALVNSDPTFQWGNDWGPINNKFFVDIEEPSDQPWATIGDKYRLDCPTPAEMTAINAGPRTSGVTITCNAYSRHYFTYKHISCKDNSVGSDGKCSQGTVEEDRTKPVPCDASSDAINTVCNDACPTASSCSGGVNTATGQAQVCLGPTFDSAGWHPQNTTGVDAHDYFCAQPGTMPYKLGYDISSDTQTGKGAQLSCPTPSTISADGLTDANGNVWTDRPFVKFTTLDDKGHINLSKRPKLCMTNDKEPTESDPSINTCSIFGKGGTASGTGVTATSEGARCIPLRIADDEVFVTNNAHTDRDLSVFAPTFGEPAWDSKNGKVTVTIDDRYFDRNEDDDVIVGGVVVDEKMPDNEKTFINIGVGECPATETVWDTNTANPMASATNTAFGSCDFIDEAHFRGLGLTKAEIFAHIFGATQPTHADYDGKTETAEMFTSQSALFQAPRAINDNAKWTTVKKLIGNHGNADLSDHGFAATFSVTLEELQKCLLRGNPTSDNRALSTKVNTVSGNTEYEFAMSVTHITARRKGDTTYPMFSTKCVDRKYKLTVGNRLMALSGLRTAGGTTAENSVSYVDSMGYQTCANDRAEFISKCDNTLGPKHNCLVMNHPAVGDNPNGANCETPGGGGAAPCLTHIRSMEYTVNLDMRALVRQVGYTDTNNNPATTSMKTYYGVAAMSSGSDFSNSVVVDSTSNCYGAQPRKVEIAEADNGAGTPAGGAVTVDPDTIRSTITFETACLNLNKDGVTQADTFANCADNTLSATDFSFKVRLYECTTKSELIGSNSPAAGASCQLLPDWFRVTIAMAFVEQLRDTTFNAPYEKLFRFYRSVDHRLANGSYPNPTALEAWRQDQILSTDAANPVVTYPSDAMAIFSLGFKKGSALESTMTSAIRDVRLCEFKKPCYMQGYTTGLTASELNTLKIPACNKDKHFDSSSNQFEEARSPLALWARNQPINATVGDPGCADKASGTRCVPSTFSSDTANPMPYLTCDTDKWENWLIAEALAVHQSSGDKSRFSDGTATLIDVSGTQAEVVNRLVTTLNPVRSAQTVVRSGKTTDYAASLYGDCETNAEILPDAQKETITLADGTQTFLHHIFPKAGPDVAGEPTPSGVCTCKGQRVANYVNTATPPKKEFFEASKRKVIYSAESYSSTKTNPANLHLCTWRNSNGHSRDDSPVSSVDQVAFSLKKMLRNVEYHFEAVSIQYDTMAYNDIAGVANQFDIGANSRRLLSLAEDAPAAAIEARAQLMHKSGVMQRSLLSTLMPIHDDVMSSTVLMPQGQVQYREADPAAPIATQAAGGFMVIGESVGHDAATHNHTDHHDWSNDEEDEHDFEIVKGEDNGYHRGLKRFEHTWKDHGFDLVAIHKATWGSHEYTIDRFGDTLLFVFAFEEFGHGLTGMYDHPNELLIASIGMAIPMLALYIFYLLFLTSVLNILKKDKEDKEGEQNEQGSDIQFDGAAPPDYTGPTPGANKFRKSASPFDVSSMRRAKTSRSMAMANKISDEGYFDRQWVNIQEPADVTNYRYEPTIHSIHWWKQPSVGMWVSSMLLVFLQTLIDIATGAYFYGGLCAPVIWLPVFIYGIKGGRAGNGYIKSGRKALDEETWLKYIRIGIYHLLDFSCYEKAARIAASEERDTWPAWFKFWTIWFFTLGLRLVQVFSGAIFVFWSLLLAVVYFGIYWAVQIGVILSQRDEARSQVKAAKETTTEIIDDMSNMSKTEQSTSSFRNSAFAPTKAESDLSKKQEMSPFCV